MSAHDPARIADTVRAEAKPVMGPFNQYAYCRMCRCENVRSAYHDGVRRRLTEYSCALVDTLRTSYPPIHICRTCERCGFQWPEETLHTAQYDGEGAE